VCGDGVLEGLEECDDGNTLGGDCCSATCELEPDGAACDDGDGCTLGDACAAGLCSGLRVLDVDGSGAVDVPTDIVYIARRLIGLVPVPPSFRELDPTIPGDEEIAGRVDAGSAFLDVDVNGVVDVPTDIVYIARYLSGLVPVPPTFRTLDPTIPPDENVAAKINELCP
jgi:cysteine-rich repeat protein